MDIKKIFTLAFYTYFLLNFLIVFSQNKKVVEPVNLNGITADYVNETYGDHQRNKFDIWLAKSDKPTPLVIYIHGGGFGSGDKSKYYNSKQLVSFLEKGISVATINYRFQKHKPYGILASLNDSKRCLQFIRYHAEKYNIDKTKIGVYGSSAGAGTSLWIAFSDDMADLDNPDLILRESTRISCVGALATQATYDFFKWPEILNLPEELMLNANTERRIAKAFGLKYEEGIDLKSYKKIIEELDFLEKIDKDDPPMFVFNNQKGGIPLTNGQKNHHPLHAKVLKDKADREGLESVVYAPKIGISNAENIDLVDFFNSKLN
ncbi:MAG: alpha/beta hydrolase [Flavobacteriaceae bacterium]|nr:alpha/beta hydrolase [Flavobacteriaceae bacterium]